MPKSPEKPSTPPFEEDQEIKQKRLEEIKKETEELFS